MIEERTEILCIGNALVDVFVCLDEQTANRLGITEPVQHVEIQKLREILDELPGKSNTACPQGNVSLMGISSGGGAANVAKIAAFLGTKAGFLGAVGRYPEGGTGQNEKADEYGQLFEKELGAAGVQLGLALKKPPTGICLFLKTGEGKTCIATALSAALEFSEADIDGEDIQKAKVVVIDGFMLDRGGIVYQILNLADKSGTVAVLDLSSVPIAREHAAEILGYSRRYSLILFMNEAEAEAFYDELEAQGLGLNDEGGEEDSKPFFSPLTAEQRNAESHLRRSCSFFQSLTKRDIFPIIVVKLGKRGAICFAGGAIYRAGTLELIPHDSIGAGDTFCAAFLSAWIKNKSLLECTALGNKAARIILGVTGTLANKKQFAGVARQLK